MRLYDLIVVVTRRSIKKHVSWESYYLLSLEKVIVFYPASAWRDRVM